jgi:hypothetical protein
VQRADERSHEGRLARPERAAQRDHVAGTERGGEAGGERVEGGAPVEDVFLCSQNNLMVLLRMSDVLVGIIAGAVCSVVAALFEALVLTARFFSMGHLGGGLGSKLLIIALVGAIVGGIVGFLVGALFKQREPVRRPPAAPR